MNEFTQGGPKAPKDPTKKRPGFCIMRNKEVCASPQADGSGVVAIYEDSGRMIDAARLVGNITDGYILTLLKNTEDFKKLVHSIGVSVESSDSKTVKFVFQMYGKTNPYVSGTSLEMDIVADGMEQVLVLSEAEWSDDDNIPGQIRFHFEKGGDMGKVTVRFYLNDGYEAPEEVEENPVKFESEEYRKMIEKSLMNVGNNVRLKRAIDKARNGEDVTVSFIGGSITQGAGAVPINTNCYAYNIFKGFCDLTGRGYEDNVHYVKAGIGGTPSELGIVRYDRDVLCNGEKIPDVVVVEFAVNDEGDETHGECFDSLIRKIYNGPGNPAVIILFAVFSSDWNLQERLSPVGFAYNLPMVSTRNSVVDQFYGNNGEPRVVSKNQYFYDCFHPTNVGHRIMADGVINLFKVVDNMPYDSKETDITKITPPIGGEFDNVIFIDRKDNPVGARIDAGSFADTDTVLQAVERDRDLKATPAFPNNWMYKGGSGKPFKPFSMDVEGSALFIVVKDSADPADGVCNVFVNGQKALRYDPHLVGWIHANSVLVFRGEDAVLRHIEVSVEDESKNFTILGFGVCK